MLASDVIDPETMEWGSPTVLVLNNRTSRFLIDFVWLNAVVIPDSYPSSFMDQWTDKFGDAAKFSTLKPHNA